MSDIFIVIFYVLIFLSIYIQVFFLITFFERKDKIVKKSKQIHIENYPSITVIIPCWNEEKSIQKTISSFLRIRYPKDKLKIFIVDDGSTDKTWEIISEFKNNSQIRLFRKKNEGKYTALNLGLKYATTEFIGCLDADSFVEPDALEKIFSYFSGNEEIMAIIPSALVHEPKNIIQNAQRSEYYMAIFLKKVFSLIGGLFVTPGTLPVYRKKVFDQLGGFNKAHLGEDMEIAFRMQKNRYKIVQCHDIHVHTIVPKSPLGLFKQRLRWSYAYINNVIDYRDMFFKKRYGDFAWFTLPAGAISILTMVFLFGYMAYNTIYFFIDKIIKINTVGFHFNFNSFNFDWFFLNNSPIIFLVIFGIILIVSFISIGNKITEKKSYFSPNILYFILIYIFLAPIWMIKAIYNTAFSRKPNWR